MDVQVNKKGMVLLVTAAYLFIALTHILFVKPNGASQKQTPGRYNSIFKRQNSDGISSQALYFIKRTDKILSRGNPDARALIARQACSFVTLFMQPQLLSRTAPAVSHTLLYSGGSPHLSRCLRI
jgi:hypothetical protein